MEEYRKGIGAIVLSKDNKIIAFQRYDFDKNWQGVEGGCDSKEKPRETLFREIKEEIGLDKTDYNIIKEFNEFIPYKFPDGIKKGINSIGQKKKFFLIKLKNEDQKFDFSSFNPDGNEFKDSKFVTAEELIKLVPQFKRDLYKKVLNGFGLIKKNVKPERLAKVIARTGYCSRREAEQLILDGYVKVNGAVVSSPAINVTDESIKIKNKLLQTKEKTKLWMFNKPRGYIVTNNDPENRKTIFSILPKDMPRVMTIGRLDMDTEGLLLLTNNGDLARYIELPSTGWTRKYRVKVHGFLDRLKNDIEKLSKRGLKINDVKYSPFKVSIETEGNTNAWLNISVSEGKNREVRNIMEYYGLKVLRLIRTSYGPFILNKDFPVGAVRQVSEKGLIGAVGNKVDLK